MTPVVSAALPPRLRALREQLHENIPAMGASAATLQTLSLPKTMLVYVNWASRFIKPRQRSVSYAPGFWKNQTALERGGDVVALEAAIRSGADLTPYLSARVLTDGYLSPTGGRRGNGLKWGDKDFALNAYGVHHLHFHAAAGKSRGAEPGKHGHLLYAEFSTREALLVMVGDHKSFDDGGLHQSVIDARAAAGRMELVGLSGPYSETDGVTENIRLARRGISTVGFKDGRAFVAATLSTAGTSPFHSTYAARILRTLSEIDAKLDDEIYWRGLFRDVGRPAPATARFEWHIQYTELAVVEHNSKTRFILLDGLN